MGQKYGFCPKCLLMKYLTKHHIYPKRFFKHSPTIFLCRECHDDLELNIPVKYQLGKRQYVTILREWLKDNKSIYWRGKGAKNENLSYLSQ